MDHTAHNSQKLKVLITDVSSYLGEKLAEKLLNSNCQVYGIAKIKVADKLIVNPQFTLLELNLNQPFPDYIDKFDFIIHLVQEQKSRHYQTQNHITAESASIIKNAMAQNMKLVLLLPLDAETEMSEMHLIGNDTTLIFIGDIYGPQMSDHHAVDNEPAPQNLLTKMIFQAATDDKLILENEGQNIVYPTYIEDALSAIYKFSFENSSKKIHYIVSESPKTTLSTAYLIQQALIAVAGKNIKLYFAGAQSQVRDQATILKIPELKFEPKVALSNGLQIVFKDLFTRGQIKHVQVQKPPVQPHNNDQHTETINSNEHKISKLAIPRISFRKIAVAVFLVAFIFLTRTAIEITLGYKNIRTAEVLIKTGDFEKAALNARNSSNHLESAQRSINFLLGPFKLLFFKKTGLENVMEAAVFGSKAVADMSDGAKVLSANLAVTISMNDNNNTPDIADAQASLQKAFFESSYALTFAQTAQGSHLVGSFLTPKIEMLKNLNALSQTTYEFTYLIGDITGSTTPETYLVLLQNNTELRPGGGFIGNYGTISFANGHLKEIKVDDIYQIDGQLKEKIEPQKQLKDKLGVDNLYLRDSNWSPDFKVNAQTARDLYKKETGQNVDGTVAIDLYFIQNILKITGPIKLANYKEEITDKNLFERGEYYAEIGFFPGSTQKKDFFSSLTRALINKITENITKKEKGSFSLVSIAQSMVTSLSQKHLMLSLDTPNVSTYTKSKGWDNLLPPPSFNPADDSYETRDFLSISEANVGANKVNYELERKISYDMTIGRDADLVARLKITYTNKSQANTWPGGTYVNYLRLYTLLGSTPFEVKNGDKTDLKSVEVTNQNNLTVFGTYVEVPIKSTREFSITYRIPKNIKLDKAPTYHVYFQKQPGTDSDQLNFTFNLPSYLAVKSINSNQDQHGKQNVSIQTNLQEDRQFTVGIAKK